METETIYLDNLPEYSMAERIRNPFTNKILNRQFDACLLAFDRRFKDLIKSDWRDGRLYQSRGNSWACHFWWGYNGVHERERYAGSYDTPAYACWKAGRAVREQLSTGNCHAS